MNVNQEMITGEHVMLRPITESDTENIVRWRSEEHTSELQSPS